MVTIEKANDTEFIALSTSKNGNFTNEFKASCKSQVEKAIIEKKSSCFFSHKVLLENLKGNPNNKIKACQTMLKYQLGNTYKIKQGYLKSNPKDIGTAVLLS